MGKPPVHKLIMAVALLTLSTAPLAAVEMAALYTAEVAVDDDQYNSRAAAYRQALEQVLLRVSGVELVAEPERVDLLFPEPAALVVRFRSGPDNTLSVSFDGEAIERVLRESGQTVWGVDRPLTLVWLAVDWGQGEREIIAADDPDRPTDQMRTIDRNRLLRQRVLDTAEQRGLPVLFPLLDTEDLQQVSFSDIWGDFDDVLLQASERYAVRSVLVGRIRPDTGQRNRWRYYFGDEEYNWSGEAEAVLGLVADVLSAEFAIRADMALESVELTVVGVDSVTAYGSVQTMLAKINVIEAIAVVEVQKDRIRYRINVRGGADKLRRALRLGGLIEENRFDGDRLAPDSSDSALEFFYSP
jgi:hypothetical protein